MEIDPQSSVTFDFFDISIPNTATVNSFVIFVDHYEQEGFTEGQEIWSIGRNWPDNPEVWIAIDSSIREGIENVSVDSWDVASFIDSAQKMNQFQLQITNNDSSKKIYIDNIYVQAKWDWQDSSSLVEYKLN